MAKQYVQHISGQGKAWETVVEYPDAWSVMNERHVLPKSEYRLCEPPVVWKDVTEECEVTERGWIVHKDRCTTEDNGYRRRKVRVVDWDKNNNEAWAIIIEQKVTE